MHKEWAINSIYKRDKIWLDMLIQKHSWWLNLCVHIAQRLQASVYGLEISLVDRIEKLEYSTDSTDVRPPTS